MYPVRLEFRSRRNLFVMLVLLILVVSGCTSTPPATPTEEPAAQPTEAPAEPTEAAEPTEEAAEPTEEAAEPTEEAAEPTEEPEPTEAPAAQTETLRIGAAISQTGQFFREGELVRSGYDLWAKVVNENGGIQVGDVAYMVEMVYYDDQGDANTATSLAARLITEDEVDFIFGPFSSGLSLAVGAITEQYQTVMIAPAGNANALFEQGHEYFFGLAAPAGTLINPFVDMVLEQETPPASIAIVSKDDLFGQTQRTGLSGYVNEAGGLEIVFDDAYAADTTDFSTLIGQIQQAAPDLIVQTGHQQDCSTFLSQLQELGYRPAAYFCSGPDMRDFFDTMGEPGAYSYGYTLGWDPNVPWCDDVIGCAEDYVQLYEEEYGEEISYQAVNAAGAGVILMTAIQEAGSIDSTAVRDALRELEITIGAGPVDYNEAGINEAASAAIQQIQPGGEVVLVWPADRAQQDPVYPAPPLE